MRDDHPSVGRPDHDLGAQSTEPIGQRAADGRGVHGMLEQQRALHVLGTMHPGAQQKVSALECLGLFEELDHRSCFHT